MQSTEKATQKAILDYLTYKGIFHYRQNTGAFQSQYKGKNSFVKFGTPGAPDIVMVVDGVYVGIEVKDSARTCSPIDLLNENQKLFKQNLERAGGKYIIARSLDDVMAFV